MGDRQEREYRPSKKRDGDEDETTNADRHQEELAGEEIDKRLDILND